MSRHQNNNSIECIYLNINGNSVQKTKFIDKITSDNTLTVIAEHWFSNYQSLRNLKSFIQSSNNQSSSRPIVGRSHGGLALLAGSSIRPLINIINITPYVIKFSVSEKVFAAIYFPPSLDLRSFGDVLNDLGHVDILFGDFNIRFGVLTRDSTTTQPQRRILLDHFTKRNSLYHCITDRCSRNDHIFARSIIPVEYVALDREQCPSDHDLLRCTLQLTQHTSPHTCILKHSLRNLSHPRLQLQIIACFQAQSLPVLTTLLEKSTRFLTNTSINDEERIEIIDRLYNHFHEELLWIMDSFLSTYCPWCIERPPFSIPPFSSNLRAIKSFKRQFQTSNLNTLLSSKSNSTPLNAALAHYQKIYSSSAMAIQTPTHQFNNRPFENGVVDSDSILNCIKSYPQGKSGGPDNIPIALLKIMCRARPILNFITNLYSCMKEFGISPTCWNTSRIVLLAKTEANLVEESRPISLTSVLRRIFERYLLLDWEKRDWSKTCEYQAGFKKGFSTYSNLILLDEEMRKEGITTIFLDLKQAYDRVPFQRLLGILEARGCPTADLRLIHSLMMRNMESTVVVNRTESKKRLKRNQGVLQGSILSPFLFNIFIDSLAVKLNEEHGSQAFLFADDIAICTLKDNAIRMAEICFNWAQTNNMEFQILKCGIINPPGEAVLLGTNVIPTVQEYKYLGLPFRVNGCNWMKYLESSSDKFIARTRALYAVRKNWDMATRSIVFKTFLHSTLTYALPMVLRWNSRQSASTQEYTKQKRVQVQDAGLEFIFEKKPGPGVSRNMLLNLANLYTLQGREELLCASLSFHLQNLSSVNPLKQLGASSVIDGDRSQILPLCFQHKWFNEWKLLQQNSPQNLPRSWKSWLHQQARSLLAQGGSKLTDYLLPTSRTLNGYSADFLSLPPNEAHSVLSWRLNHFGMRQKCGNCLQPYNRRHIDQCNLLRDIPENTLTKIQPITRQDKETLATLNRNLPLYSHLDTCLNHKFYQEFFLILNLLRQNLH